jgi:Protein of unknown function (DUF1214)
MKLRNRILAAAIACGIGVSMTGQAEETTTPLKTWTEYMSEMVAVGERAVEGITDPKDELMRQELYKFLHQMMSQSYFELQYQDPRYPDFWPMFNQVYPIFFANPDDSYYQAVVEGSGVYRISGYRGKTRIVDFEIGSGMYVPYAKGVLGPTLAHYDLDRDVKLRDDGYFEVILSAERPSGWKGDWWKLGKDATFIWVRQISYDWKDEDGRFAIERLDVPAARPRDSAQRIAEGMQQIPVWAEGWTRAALAWMDNLRKQGLVNKVTPRDLSATGGITTQRYIQGLFDIQPDEALILETEIPERCRYWMFQLTEELTNTIDPLNRQTTLNGHTAKLDDDGKLRLVISAQDPGVPNWLDTVGYQRGMIVGRWLECNRFPEPQVTKVKFADVRKLLPKNTPVVTAEQRDATIRERRQLAQLRRRW